MEQDPGKTHGPVERGARAGAGLPMGLVTSWGISARAVHEEQKPMKISHIEEVHGAMSPMGGTPYWSREGVRRKEKPSKHEVN